jgi:hypothetical protein
MSYYRQSPLAAVLGGLTQGLTQGGVDWWRSKLEEKAMNRKVALGSILQSMIGADPETQDRLAAEAKKFNFTVPAIEKPQYATQEGMGITPMPGAPLQDLVPSGSRREYALPALDKERFVTATLMRQPKEMQTKAALASVSPSLLELPIKERQVAVQEGGLKVQQEELPLKKEELRVKEKGIEKQYEAAMARVEQDKRQVDASFAQIASTGDHYKAVEAIDRAKATLEAYGKAATTAKEYEALAQKQDELANSIVLGMKTKYNEQPVPKDIQKEMLLSRALALQEAARLREQARLIGAGQSTQPAGTQQPAGTSVKKLAITSADEFKKIFGSDAGWKGPGWYKDPR